MKYWSSALPLFLLRHETATAFSVVSKIVTPTKSSTTRVFAESSSYSPLDGEQRINLKQDLESPKVATQDEVVGGDKKVYCRCWMSGTFPLCDGQHMKHNKATGDNVGPLIVSVPKATTKVAEPNFVMAKSSEDAKEEEEKGKPKKHVTRKKIAGRKKRVILGYRLTSVAYLASTIAILAVMGVRGSSVFFGSGHVLAAGLGYILASAAENDRLDSDTYKRLNLCLTDYGLVGLGMVAVATEFRQSPIFIIPALIAAINSVKGYAYGVLGWDKSGDVTMIKDFAEGTKSTLPSGSRFGPQESQGRWIFGCHRDGDGNGPFQTCRTL
jgi:CDGSH-type Zn-finger protein